MNPTRNVVMRRSRRNSPRGFVRQIAPVTDRRRLRAAEQRMKLVEESERLSKTLLDSISQEFRSPISAITGAAAIFNAARDP
jgi:K+-sensing histidine kinase KdpD